MSRSCKKHPIIGDYRKSKKRIKRFANKKIRKMDNVYIPDGSWYKKCYQQYDICDYKSFIMDKRYFEVNYPEENYDEEVRKFYKK